MLRQKPQAIGPRIPSQRVAAMNCNHAHLLIFRAAVG
jgi:hypothetical protein